MLLAPAIARADDAWLEPADASTERFLQRHHELGAAYGVGGPLAGAGRFGVSSLRYLEANGEVLDATLGALVRAISSYERHDDCTKSACTFMAMEVYLPFLFGERSVPQVRGYDWEFGLTFAMKRVLFQAGVSLGFAWIPTGADAPPVGNARDALFFTLQLPLSKWISLTARFDANLYALLPKGELHAWRRDSPVTLGAHADLGHRVYAEVALLRGDVVRGGAGWTFGAGLRF
jgi:hypothetical protein